MLFSTIAILGPALNQWPLPLQQLCQLRVPLFLLSLPYRNLWPDSTEKDSPEHPHRITTHHLCVRCSGVDTAIGRVQRIHRLGSRHLLAVDAPGFADR
jgi:hypothetical protein